MTQEEIIADIYQNPKEIWKIEKKHQSPHLRQPDEILAEDITWEEGG